jgi:glycosyltransferase involved in cell wall biosynthesis
VIKISAVLSIHNRSKLFKRALDGYLRQSMPPEEWEIILVDDLSTEDLSKAYEPWVGRVNLRHIRMDHTKHAYFAEMNPGWRPGEPKHWYHTPALSTNIGCAAARGTIICLCHPEILHAPANFQRAFERLLREKVYVFGRTFLGTQRHNVWLEEHSWTESGDWTQFLRNLASIERVTWFRSSELYWYTSFLPREAVEMVRGVDFEYLKGVAGEDDDFRERVKRAGWPPVYAEDIGGFHQDHSDETEGHRRRDTEAWQKGLAQNRKTYQSRVEGAKFPEMVNVNYDWTARDCIVSDVSFSIGVGIPT